MIEKFKDIKGFLSEHEGSALFEYCEKFCIDGIAVEIGSYCGKSACYLGYACKKNNSKSLPLLKNPKFCESQPLNLITIVFECCQLGKRWGLKT